MTFTRGSEEIQHQIIEQLRISLRLLGGNELASLDQLSSELRRLGANRELLGLVGSWGDTLQAEEVLALLKEWNLADEELQRERQPLSA